MPCRRLSFDSWVRKIPWRREWQPTLVFLPGEFHGQRSLAGYSPWGHKESDMTKQLSNKEMGACGHGYFTQSIRQTFPPVRISGDLLQVSSWKHHKENHRASLSVLFH